MSDNEERQQQEYEFIMEGITTRMQIAMEKISESNSTLRSIVKFVCFFMIAIVIIVVSGFVVTNQIWIGHVNQLRHETTIAREVSADEKIPEFGQGTFD